MSLRTIMNSDIVSVPPTMTVAEAARVMDLKNVGCLLVLNHGNLEGILTDRDIVTRCVNMERSPAIMTVNDAMTPNPETLHQDLGLMEALQQVRDKPIRRFPVVDGAGKAVGIFTVDDVVYMLGKELSLVGEILEQERALI